MKKLVLIGGGEIGRPGFPVETTSIDKEIIKLSNKSNPRVLFIPTASSDAEGYIQVVNQHFGKRLGCEVESLKLINSNLLYEEIRKKILGAEIIYVGGGNTLKMMKIWRRLKVNKILEEAMNEGKVLSGLSAGAICWCRYGTSDSRKFTNQEAGLIKVSGLNFVNVTFCPHYNVEADRRPNLKKMMKKTNGIAIAVENCCAIEIINEEYRVLTSRTSANAYKVFWKGGKFYEQKLKKSKKYSQLSELLSKTI